LSLSSLNITAWNSIWLLIVNTRLKEKDRLLTYSISFLVLFAHKFKEMACRQARDKRPLLNLIFFL
jgi:hypothetical protein